MSTLDAFRDLLANTASRRTPADAASITRSASQQTYLTIRFLADRDRVADAFRAYAYFRWVDDRLDRDGLTRPDRMAFVRRQQTIIDACYRGVQPPHLSDEESMLAQLIGSDLRPHSGLRTYVCQMMEVMAFDADRRGRVITQAELDGYTRWLAVGVTEAIHTFIGSRARSPAGDSRYQAVTGAHIIHMLRDTLEDVESGYFNVPREVLDSHGFDPHDVSSAPYRQWVNYRVNLARQCLSAGRDYFSRVESLRCRVAGLAYITRFESVLDTIRRDDYHLRSSYPDSNTFTTGAKLVLASIAGSNRNRRGRAPGSAMPAPSESPR